MPVDDRTASRLVLRMYGAAERPEEWQAVLETVRVIVNGSGATLLHHEPATNHRSVEAYAGLSSDAIQTYHRHYQRLDPWGNALTSGVLRPEHPVDGRMLVSDEDVERSEYYADFGRLVGSGRSAFVALEPLAERTALLVVGRDLRQPPFERSTLDILESLAPHLRQALRLHRRIAALKEVAETVSDALDRVPTGIVLVDDAGRVCRLNRSAEQILSARDGLQIMGGLLRADCSSGSMAIAHGIREVAALAATESVTPARTTVTVPRPSGRRSYRLLIAPARTLPDRLGTARSRVAIFISDPDLATTVDERLLAELFDLTRTESKIAARLAGGDCLEHISRALGMKITTARWHVKRVLAKIDVGTQAQLVALVLKSPAALGRADRP